MNLINAREEELTWRQACAAALVGLAGMGPIRLATALGDMAPEAVWEALAGQRELTEAFAQACKASTPAQVRQWRQVARTTDPLKVLSGYRARGVDVWWQLDAYPESLRSDQCPPAVLFTQGRIELLDVNRPRVAIVGTRRCTYEGAETARRFGAELTEAGASVVSGLALGIDGAAHEGALRVQSDNGPIAVVGCGLDIVYPKRHHKLWAQVRESGLLVSEAPLGAPPEPWRFPARNRIIAALADVVVVVESHERGGSLLTVDQALLRDVPIMAVPGSLRNPASRGTNLLLADGCAPVCSVDDILRELGLIKTALLSSNKAESATAQLSKDDQLILAAVGYEPTTTDEILLRLQRSLGEVAAALFRLEQGGRLRKSGGWWQRLT